MLKNGKKGFTLIELLVVIAIIAILAAILFPVFAKARGKARQAACMSNVKQLALGIIMYAEDYDSTYPRTKGIMPGLVNGGSNYWGDDCMADWQVFYYGGYQNSLWCWQDFIYPYTKSMKVAYCPDGGGNWAPTGSFGGVAQGQYGANIFIVGSEESNFAEIQAGIKTDAAVKDPASKYMVMDWGCYYAYAYECYTPGWSSFLPGSGKIPEVKAYNDARPPEHEVGSYRNNPDSGNLSDFINGRHNGGVCIAYADGHAKYQTVEKVLQGAYNWANNLVNRRSPVAGYVEKPDPWSPEFSINSD